MDSGRTKGRRRSGSNICFHCVNKCKAIIEKQQFLVKYSCKYKLPVKKNLHIFHKWKIIFCGRYERFWLAAVNLHQEHKLEMMGGFC